MQTIAFDQPAIRWPLKIFISFLILVSFSSLVHAQQDNEIIPGEKIGEFKLGLSEKDTNKLIGKTSETQTFVSFKDKKLDQITSKNPKNKFSKNVFVGGFLSDFLSFFPDSKRAFVPGNGDYLDVYYYDSNSGIGVQFTLGEESEGKFSLKDLTIAAVIVFPKGAVPAFSGTPLPSEPVTLIPGVSVGDLKLGMTKNEVHEITGTAQDITDYDHTYNDAGKLAQIANRNPFCSIEGKVSLCNSLNDFLTRFPEAKPLVKKETEEEETHYFYDKKSGIGLSWQMNPAVSRQKDMSPGNIIPFFLSNPTFYVFEKNSEPPFLNSVKSESVPNLSEEIVSLLEKWLVAQNSGDFPSYCKFYAPNFNGIKRAKKSTKTFDTQGWLADRKKMIESKGGINVSVKNLRIEQSPDGFSLSFDQYYRSPTYSDWGPKIVKLQRSPSGLQFVYEELLESNKMEPGLITEENLISMFPTDEFIQKQPSGNAQTQPTAEMPKVIPQELPQSQQMQPSRPTGNTPHNGVRSPAVQTTSPVQPTGNSGQKPEGFTTEHKILGGLSVLLALLLRRSFRRTSSNGPNVRKVYDWYRMFQHFLSAGFFAAVVVGVAIFAIINGQKALISLPMIVISIGVVLVSGFNSAKNAIVIIDKDDDRITYPILFSLLTSSVKISEIEDIGSDVQLEHSSQGLLAGLFGMAALASQEKEIVEIICLIGKFGTVSITFSSSFKYQETLNAIRQARKN